MNTNLLDNIIADKCCDISISKNYSYIYINDSGYNNDNHRDLTEKAFKIGRKLDIHKYLFDSSKLNYHYTFVKNCDYFYNTIFHLSSISVAEKIAILIGSNSQSYSLIYKLTKYYMDNFKVFSSRKSAVEYLIDDSSDSSRGKRKYPCSAIPKQSLLELRINTKKSACLLCGNTHFRFNPDRNQNNPFKCMQCGAEYSITDFSYTTGSRCEFNIIN